MSIANLAEPNNYKLQCGALNIANGYISGNNSLTHKTGVTGSFTLTAAELYTGVVTVAGTPGGVFNITLPTPAQYLDVLNPHPFPGSYTYIVIANYTTFNATLVAPTGWTIVAPQGLVVGPSQSRWYTILWTNPVPSAEVVHIIA